MYAQHTYFYTQDFEELNKQLLTAYFEVIQEHFFREVTFSIFDQRDGQKDDVTMVKKDQVCSQQNLNSYFKKKNTCFKQKIA